MENQQETRRDWVAGWQYKLTVELRRGAVLHKQSVSPPRSSNRTCGFPASGSPTGFTAGMRRASDTSVMSVSTPPWLHGTACSESFRNYAVLYRLAPSHPPSPSSTSTPEVRVLSSTGVTQLHRYYDPVRLPLEPMPYGTVEAATLAQYGPPPLARSPVSTCRAHYPGGRSRCVCRLLPQIVLPSPNSGRVGIHNFPFEACSGFIRISARRVARPPEADFVAGLRSSRLLN